MFDIKLMSLVHHNGRKWIVKNVSENGLKITDHRGYGFKSVPRSAVKPVIRLTPLVRAEMLIQAVKNHIKNVYVNTAAPELLCIRGVLIHEDQYFKARDAARFIQSIGGYEAAQLYTDCDGYVNGRFIRGDDVRQALRILEGL